MGEIIDTNQSIVFLVIMGSILASIIINDTNKIMAKRDAAAAAVVAGESERGLSGWMRDIVNNYWPTVFGIIGMILGGPLVDKVNTRSVIPVYLVPMFLGILLLAISDNPIVIFIF